MFPTGNNQEQPSSARIATAIHTWHQSIQNAAMLPRPSGCACVQQLEWERLQQAVDELLLRSFRNSTLLVPAHRGGRISPNLRWAGSQVQYLADGQWLALPDRFTTLYFADRNQNSAALKSTARYEIRADPTARPAAVGSAVLAPKPFNECAKTDADLGGALCDPRDSYTQRTATAMLQRQCYGFSLTHSDDVGKLFRCGSITCS